MVSALSAQVKAVVAGAVVVAGLAVAGCSAGAKSDNSLTSPHGGAPARVVVEPAMVNMGLGVPVPFSATVLDSAGTLAADQHVRWTVSPATVTATVSDSGVATWRCYPGGTAHVVATSVADSMVFGDATIISVFAGTGDPSISAINDAGTGQPANLDSLTDSVRVATTLDPSQFPCYGMREADLVITRPAGDTTVDRVALDSTSSAHVQVNLLFHSDAKAGSAPVFPNGSYSMYVQSAMTGTLSPQKSSIINFTIKNP